MCGITQSYKRDVSVVPCHSWVHLMKPGSNKQTYKSNKRETQKKNGRSSPIKSLVSQAWCTEDKSACCAHCCTKTLQHLNDPKDRSATEKHQFCFTSSKSKKKRVQPGLDYAQSWMTKKTVNSR